MNDPKNGGWHGMGAHFAGFLLLVGSAWRHARRQARLAALEKHFEGFREDHPPATQAGKLLRISCEIQGRLTCQLN